MGTLFSVPGALFAAAGARFSILGPPPIEPVARVDLQRYAGRWYQIGLMRNSFQRGGSHNVTATYTYNPSLPGLDILNESMSGDERSWIRGVAIRDPEARGDDDMSARLLVTFTPNETAPLVFPMGSPYWIVQLGNDLDYGYAVVSDPDRRHLWILSRTFPIDPSNLGTILWRLVHEQGFDPERLSAIEWTIQETAPLAYGPVPSAPPQGVTPGGP